MRTRLPWRLFACLLLVAAGVNGFAEHRKQWGGPNDLVATRAEVEKAQCVRFSARGTRGVSSSVYSRPEVRYRYSVNGSEYVSSRYARYIDAAFSTLKECQAYASEARDRRFIQIWVSKNHPDYSVIERDVPPLLLEPVFILVGAALGVWSAWSAIRNRKRVGVN